jgi:(E)-4-hydroxy-3-methylbut-2-enyl-diphosphate synthase
MQTLPNPVAAEPTTTTTPPIETTIRRRVTRPVQVGNITIGGNAPVVVQSMINEDTLDIDGSVAGIRRLHEIGCEIVRVTVPSIGHAKALAAIRAKLKATYQDVPLVADVHHNG